MADTAIATVTAITGKAYARSAEGELRELRPGDVLLEGETVVTPDGGAVELALEDGSPFVISDVSELALTRDIVAERAAAADESAVQDDTVAAVLAALEGDGDILEQLDAPAAGAGGEAADSETHSFVRLGRIVEETPEFTGLAAFGDRAAVLPLEESEQILPVDAIDDQETTEQNIPVLINVQANDIFTEGSIVTAVTQPESGTVVINPDNTLTFTPNQDFVGETTFTYTATTPDGTNQDTAVVTIVVTGPGEPQPEPQPEP
ncbi:MAG: retention module-containing protein, partial [Haliea sp.]|uniref:retention module-containing protein n=1 Tax=Haliea sp. TaxID=1932666 RepID=UPI0032EF08EB